NKQYNEALSACIYNYKQTANDNFALMGLVCAMCLDDSAAVEEIKKASFTPSLIALADFLLGRRNELEDSCKIFYLKMLEDTFDLYEFNIFAKLLTTKNYFLESIDQEIGNLFYERQEWELALDQYKEAFKNRPLNPELYLHTARCLQNLEQHDAALKILLQGLQNYPEQFDIYYQLLSTCMQINKIDLLRYGLKLAVDNFPESAWIKAMII
ncbi:MAG: hypothetical protein H0Z24_10080, partial [Thermosipho sp. (in: Bacteria)]|nr:hypothetical protein [Thermosipho sp. (in: thermotogales)]